MSQTWNQHVVKKENKTLVLDQIREHAPISRASIAQQTGLNKGTVSSLVSELMNEKLISESGTGQSSGGRRPVMLLFNQQAGFTISIDLGVKNILGVLCDLKGNILEGKKIILEDNQVEIVLERLYGLINELIAAAPDAPYGIVGIGIGVPGVISNEGEVLLAPNLDWKNVQLKEILADKYQLPIVVENEANAGAIGEKTYGAGQKSNDLVYVSVGTGIGVGLILDGELYKGIRGFSGELGHMTIERDGLKCRCGNTGCWELYASENALLSKAKTDQFKSIHTIVKAAEKNDKEAISLLNDMGKYLGIGITNILHIFNPEQVILGNAMIEAEKFVLPAILEYIDAHTIGFNRDDVKISGAMLKEYSTVLGIASVNIELFFKENQATLELLS
ncbi:ROK family transcriptional regulator [Saliterribacillus persicus]|uniref:ROK family transcriptional regulator n=1 Tax=Saliterribacillus persicus TaxID=930114 RepID=UPI000DF25988|nr:ROK family transcriptional regulator [Saliterribacillus persicus]